METVNETVETVNRVAIDAKTAELVKSMIPFDMELLKSRKYDLYTRLGNKAEICGDSRGQLFVKVYPNKHLYVDPYFIKVNYDGSRYHIDSPHFEDLMLVRKIAA